MQESSGLRLSSPLSSSGSFPGTGPRILCAFFISFNPQNPERSFLFLKSPFHRWANSCTNSPKPWEQHLSPRDCVHPSPPHALPRTFHSPPSLKENQDKTLGKMLWKRKMKSYMGVTRRVLRDWCQSWWPRSERRENRTEYKTLKVRSMDPTTLGLQGRVQYLLDRVQFV